MTPQQFVYLFLIIPLISLLGILARFLRLFLYVDTSTITATCVSKNMDSTSSNEVDASGEVTSFVTYECDGELCVKRKLATKYNSFNVGDKVQIYVDLLGRPRQEIDFNKEMASLGISMSIFTGLVFYFLNIILPTVHRGM